MFLAQLRHVSVSCRWVPGTDSQDCEPSLHIHGVSVFVNSLSQKNKVHPSVAHGPRLPTLDPTIVKKDELLWWT